MFLLRRAVNVFGCAYLVNLVRQEHQKIPMKHQKALWYSGEMREWFLFSSHDSYLYIYALLKLVHILAHR